MEKMIRDVLDILISDGHQAFLVGGFVRDTLIGKSTFDVDICTDALPKDIHKLFNSTKNNYGSVNIKIDKYNIDITTFRKDYDYVNRRPSKVEYINSLEEDLQRRDFTINAICMDINDNIIDYLSGINDLNNRIIKCIGDISTKLKEDPLRILRAIRFSTVLNFEIEENLLMEIKENSNLISNLSKERIKDELEKILLSKNFLKGLKLLDETGISRILKLSYTDINYVDDLLGMWSQLKVSNIPFTNNEKSNIIKITEVVKLGKINNETLYKYGLYICTIAGKILNINPKDIIEKNENLPISAKDDLQISVEEIKEIVGNGKAIGEAKNLIISLILKGSLNNNNKDIKEFLIKRK